TIQAGTSNLIAGNSISAGPGGLIAGSSVNLTAGNSGIGDIGSPAAPILLSAQTLTANSAASNGNQFLIANGTVRIITANGLNAGTGTITLLGGTFLVEGSTLVASPVVVGGGATLGGNGTVGGPVIVNGGGFLAPGDSPGTLRTGSLTLNPGSTLLE